MAELLEEPKELDLTEGQEPGEADGDDTKPKDPLVDREDLQKELLLLSQKVYGWDKAERRAEVLDVRQQRFYWRGIQYICWDEPSGCYMNLSGESQMVIGSASIDMPKYTDVYNIYTPFGRALIAAFTQNQPGVRFKAEDPRNGKDITAKSEAERYRHHFDAVNDNKKLQQDMARYYYTDGRVVTWSRFDDELGREIAEAFGVLETKVPARAKSIAKWPYACIAQEKEVVELKEDHADYADKIQAGQNGIGDNFEITARLGVLGRGRGTANGGDSGNHLTTEYYIWFRPSMFRECDKKKGKEADANKTVSKELRDMFKTGVRVCFVGDTYCGSVEESMDDHLEVSHPLPGDGQNRPSMGRDVVPLQDVTNDSYNLWKETYDYCIPVTYMNIGVNDIAALHEQASIPGNHLPMKKKDGESMADQFYRDQPASVTGDFISFLQDVKGPFAQFVSGALPSLYGASMPDQETAAGYAMAREQAMGQMGLPWGSMQRHFARIYEQVATIAAHKREGQKVNVEVPSGRKGKTKIEELNFENLRGKVLCFPDVDSSFPETFSAKQAAFQKFLQLGGPQALTFIDTPNNLEVTKDMIGLEDLEIAGAESCEKQRRELERLLQETPVPDTAAFAKAKMEWTVKTAAAIATAKTQGQEPPAPAAEPQQKDFLKTSVPIDEKMEKGLHHYHFEELQRFFESIDGEDAKQNNPKGWFNARLHALDHDKIAEQEDDAKQQKKPPSMAMNFKDMPVEGQMQMAALDGIKLNPPPQQPGGAAAAA